MAHAHPLHCRVPPWTSCSNISWEVNRHTMQRAGPVSIALQFRLVSGMLYIHMREELSGITELIELAKSGDTEVRSIFV